jgi:hypothetical protein
MTDQPQCLCRLSNVTLSLTENAGVLAITPKSLGGTCGKKTLSFHLGCSSGVCVHPLIVIVIVMHGTHFTNSTAHYVE